MRFPRVLLAVPLIGGGILVPALGPQLETPPNGVIGMRHHSYVLVRSATAADARVKGRPVITIQAGQTLTFQNNSRWIHILGPGDKGLLAPPGDSAMTPRKMLEENDSYTTPPWRTPGTYSITCTVHPRMNATIVVLP